MFHLDDRLPEKFPVLNGQIIEGWKAHYDSPIHVKDILESPTSSEFGWEDEAMEWLVRTVRPCVKNDPGAA